MLVEAIKTEHGFLIPINDELKKINKNKIFVEIKEAGVNKSKTMAELEKYRGDPLIDLMLKHNPPDYEYKEEKDDNEILYEALK